MVVNLSPNAVTDDGYTKLLKILMGIRAAGCPRGAYAYKCYWCGAQAFCNNAKPEPHVEGCPWRALVEATG